MSTRKYFEERKFNKDYRNGYFIHVPEDQVNGMLDDTVVTPTSSGLYAWRYVRDTPLKPEVLDLLDRCRPFKMVRHNRSDQGIDFYFMWSESYNLFKLSFDI